MVAAWLIAWPLHPCPCARAQGGLHDHLVAL